MLRQCCGRAGSNRIETDVMRPKHDRNTARLVCENHVEPCTCRDRSVFCHLYETTGKVGENINEESLIILVQEHECLYNLAHRDYDNNLIKDNIWNDIARSLSTTGNFRIY